ncbi:glycosyltransferase family 87 protein [Altererythrobacter sp.]|uniref:glycosyltransferase family 87 protein n=1 Tax=Altererythrobacter sp. TaxID=1872480 RepID=UPI001B0E5C66|nr:glycosyltransferase family 87 protein [Altererythrobacter sp.]MBO6945744.1 DUF2029 domain-containing protein [Altererythrobacter sp.]
MRWAWVFLAVAGLVWLSFIYHAGNWPILPLDISVYWAGGLQALSDDAGAVYDADALDRYLGELHGVTVDNNLRFPYPPFVLLLLWPLGFLPFEAVWPVFLLPGMIAFFLIARKFTDDVTAWGMTFAFGGPIHSIQLGQNGFYTATLLAGGLLALKRSKLLAGIIIGLLAFKPHLAAVGFLALLHWREWKALGWAIATVMGLVAFSALIFGPSIWLDFFVGNASFVDEISTTRRASLLENFQQSSLSLTVGWIGMSGGLIAQAAVAIAALALCARIRNHDLAIAGVLTTTLLVAPYSFVYDSTMLVLACAILINHDRQLSLGLALLIGLTGLWFLTLVTIVPFVAATILLLAWMKDQNAAQPANASPSLGNSK